MDVERDGVGRMRARRRSSMAFRWTVPLVVVWSAWACGGMTSARGETEPRPNVLLITVDDLRPQLACYGESYMITPHLDRLAERGRLFERHYAQVPTCGASRFALLTGLRPSGTGALGNNAFARLRRAGATPIPTLPELFRGHGYTTVCIGKISHQPDGKVYSYDGQGEGDVEVPRAWSELATPYGRWNYGWGAFFGYASGVGRTFHPHPTPTEGADVLDSGYPDGLLAEAAVDALRRLADRPFFLAVGFYKPHLPFNAPKKYWDLYREDRLPPSPNPERPSGISDKSWHASDEMFGRYRHPAGRAVDADHARHLRHGYCACVSYVDAQIGKVLDELERLRLDRNTTVLVWGDHGWHLGDHGIWGKHTNFERALRSALIVRTPDMRSPGVPTSGIVETLDLYPTLAQVCRLPAPEGLSGRGLLPLLMDARHPGKDAAFGYWRGGRTMRTDRWRITEYPGGSGEKSFVELYDHRSDPNETTNVRDDHPRRVSELLNRLREDSPELMDVRR